MNNSIFISYKRKDTDRVLPIKDFIEAGTGVECWIDTDGIESDALFKKVIMKAIRECEVFLFMYSSTHTKVEVLDNDWTVKEINFAEDKHKRIVIINLDRSELVDDLKFDYGSKQQIFADDKKSMSRLVSDIRKWLELDEKDDKKGSEKHSDPKPDHDKESERKSFKFKKKTGKILSNIWNSAHGSGDKPEKSYKQVVSNVMEWISSKDEPRPKSLAIVSGDRKICFVLSEDETFYLANLNQQSDDFEWWNNQTIALVGAGALIAGAPLLAVVGAGLAGLAKLWMPKMSAKLFGDKKVAEDSVGVKASKELCEKLSEATGYTVAMPTVDELKDVAKDAWDSCIVIRVKDNARHFEKED